MSTYLTDLLDLANRLAAGNLPTQDEIPNPLRGHFGSGHEAHLLLNALTDEMAFCASRTRYHVARGEADVALGWVDRWLETLGAHDRAYEADRPRMAALAAAHDARAVENRQKVDRLQPTIAPEVLNECITEGFTICRSPGLRDIVVLRNAPLGSGRCSHCSDRFSPMLEDTKGDSWCVECLPLVAAGRVVKGVLPKLCDPCSGTGSVKAPEDPSVDVVCTGCAGRGIEIVKEAEGG